MVDKTDTTMDYLRDVQGVVRSGGAREGWWESNLERGMEQTVVVQLVSVSDEQ